MTNAAEERWPAHDEVRRQLPPETTMTISFAPLFGVLALAPGYGRKAAQIVARIVTLDQPPRRLPPRRTRRSRTERHRADPQRRDGRPRPAIMQDPTLPLVQSTPRAAPAPAAGREPARRRPGRAVGGPGALSRPPRPNRPADLLRIARRSEATSVGRRLRSTHRRAIRPSAISATSAPVTVIGPPSGPPARTASPGRGWPTARPVGTKRKVGPNRSSRLRRPRRWRRGPPRPLRART